MKKLCGDMVSISGKDSGKPLLVAVLGLCVSFSASYSGPLQAADIMSMKPFPRWFKQSMKREMPLESESSFTLEALNAKGQVRSKSLTQEQGDGFWLVNLDIGTEAPVECYSFSVFDGPANSMTVLIDNAINNMPVIYNKTLAGKFNFAQDVGVIGNVPYLSVDTLYHLGKGKAQLYGLVKGLAAKTGDTLHVCLHNELGYRETFLSVFTSFIQAFKDHQDEASFFESAYRLSIDGMPVGFMTESYAFDADGDVAIVKNSSVALPIDASVLTRLDTVGQEWSTPEGALINANTYSVQNSELASQYFLERKEQLWRVDGQRKGETIDASLEQNESAYSADLVSSYGSYLATVELLNAEKNNTKMPRWVPEAEPTKVSDIGLSKLLDDDRANLSFDMGSIKMQFLSNPDGVFQSGSVEQAGLTMKMELIYSKGSPKQP